MRLNPLTNTLQEPLPNPSQHPPDHPSTDLTLRLSVLTQKHFRREIHRQDDVFDSPTSNSTSQIPPHFGFKVFYLKPTLNPTLETLVSTWDPVGPPPVPIHTCVHTCAPCVSRQDPMLPRAELGLFPCQSTKDEPNSTTPTPRTQFFDPNPLQRGRAQQDPRYSRIVELLRSTG